MDYKAVINQKTEDFIEAQNAVMADPSLTREEKEARTEEMFGELQDEVEAVANKALKKHTDDQTAVDMVLILAQYDILEGEQLLETVRTLGPTVQDDRQIKALCASIQEECAAVGQPFIDFSVVQPSGKKLSLSDFAGKGKPCLVDFWASWCPPCKQEIPNLKEVYDKYSKKGLVMVSVAVWDDPQASIDTAAAYGICWNQIVNAREIPTELYGIDGIPYIMLIGADGNILKKDLRGPQISKAVKKLF